jgi:hypothetical protein
MKNKYIKVSHISEAKLKKIVKLFCPTSYKIASVDLSASKITNLINLNRNTINRYLTLFRERIVKVKMIIKEIDERSEKILEFMNNRWNLGLKIADIAKLK